MVGHPAPVTRFLPAVPAGFVLGDHEPLSTGMRRITLDQFDLAIRGLTGDTNLDKAVHEARKAMKRLRAALRLVRSEVGDKVYRAENAFLRDTAKVIAPLRESRVLIDTVIDLRDRFDAQLRPTALAGIGQRLSERHDAIVSDATSGQAVGEVVHALRSARARYMAWPTEADPHPLPGYRPIAHRFASIGPGLARTYGRGRDEMRDAMDAPTAERLHLWRKRAKYLRHQMELLESIWPEHVGGYARSLDRLGESLGGEHDLVVLLRRIASEPGLCPDPVERSMLVALAQHRRAELQRAAFVLGQRIYAESPLRFVERFDVYWRAWDEPPPVGYLQ